MNEKRILAIYKVPIGKNDATLTISGDEITPEDFTALAWFVDFARKQCERKLTPPEPKTEYTKIKTGACVICGALVPYKYSWGYRCEKHTDDKAPTCYSPECGADAVYRDPDGRVYCDNCIPF